MKKKIATMKPAKKSPIETPSYPVAVEFEDAEMIVYTIKLPGGRSITEQCKQSVIPPRVLPERMTLKEYHKFLKAGGARKGTAVPHFENNQIAVFTVTLDDGRTFTRHVEKRKLSVNAPVKLAPNAVADPTAVKFVERYRRTVSEQRSGNHVRL